MPADDFSRIERASELTAQYEMEYETLREEIMNCTKYTNDFSTFSMTALAAVLTFAFSTGNALLFLVPYVLIIPLASKTLYYRKNVAKLSAYMIVMLETEIEGYRWETLNRQYKEEKSHGYFTVFRNYEYLLESCICTALYFCYASTSSLDFPILVAGGIVGVIALIYISVTAYKAAHTGQLKNKSIAKWEEVKGSWKHC